MHMTEIALSLMQSYRKNMVHDIDYLFGVLFCPLGIFIASCHCMEKNVIHISQ